MLSFLSINMYIFLPSCTKGKSVLSYLSLRFENLEGDLQVAKKLLKAGAFGGLVNANKENALHVLLKSKAEPKSATYGEVRIGL